MLRPMNVSCPYCNAALSYHDGANKRHGNCRVVGDCPHLVFSTIRATWPYGNNDGAYPDTDDDPRQDVADFGIACKGQLGGDVWLPPDEPEDPDVLRGWCERVAGRVPCEAFDWSGPGVMNWDGGNKREVIHSHPCTYSGLAVFALEPVDFGEALREVLASQEAA